MSIVIPDLDKHICNLCDLFQDYHHILLVNYNYHDVITSTNLYQQWKLTHIRLITYRTTDDKSDEEVLYYACQLGFIDLVKYIYSNRQIASYCPKMYLTCSEYGRLDIMQWLFETGRIIFFLLDWFVSACQNGHLDMAKWFYSHVDLNDNLYALVFKFAANCGYLDMVQWLYGMRDTYHFDLHLGNVFMSSCDGGNLATAMWIYETAVENGLTIDMEWLDPAFMRACTSGKLDIAMWLYELNSDMGIGDDVFNNVCGDGHLEVAKWLYAKRMLVGIPVDPDVFFFVSRRRNVEMMQWVWDLIGDQICLYPWYICKFWHNDHDLYSLLLDAGRDDRLPMVKWYWNLGLERQIPIDIHCRQDKLFRQWCRSGSIKSVQWLIEVDKEVCGRLEPKWWLYCSQLFKPVRPININAKQGHAFMKCCNNGHVMLAKWLYETGLVGWTEIDLYCNPVAGYKSYYLEKQWRNYFPRLYRWLYQVNQRGKST